MSTEIMPGKKVKMEIFAEDVQVLREKGQDFQRAIMGKTIQPDDRVMFNDVMMRIKSTKPKGPIQVTQKTAIKMDISKEPMMMTCSHCGQDHQQYSATCPGCGTAMQVVAI